MNLFTIDAENNIRAFAGSGSSVAGHAEAHRFTSQKELAKLAADWPLARLVETWNQFAGIVPWDDLRPVKKFTNRDTAVRRIWQAIQKLAPGQAATIATPDPDPASQSRAAAHSTASANPPKARRIAKSKNKRARAKQLNIQSREGTKKAAVLALIERSQGATLAEIQKATGWQAHSVRGFISATIGNKMGLAVESLRREDGQRVYRLAGGKA